MENIPSFFRLAKNVSKTSHHRVKMGAVIVKNGNVISISANRAKTHPKAAWEGHGLHCEVSSILYAGKCDLNGSSIFVYRENKKGKISIAKPCKECQKVLKKYGFRKMYYTIDEYPYFEVEKI